MVRALLIRGMLVGFLAGLLVFGFAKIFGEPQVDRAIAFETAMDEAKMKADLAKGIHDEPEPELVSRANQASWGLLTGVMTYATAFGGLFALVFAYRLGRSGHLSPRALSALLALAASLVSPVATGIAFGWFVPMAAVSMLALAVARLNRSANIGLSAALIAWTQIEQPSFVADKSPVDRFGIALLAIGMVSLQYVLEEGNRDGWLESRTIAFLSVVAAIALIRWAEPPEAVP